MTTRPWGAPPIEMSKYTLFVTSALQSSGAESAVGQPSASAGATAAAATAAAEPTRAARREDAVSRFCVSASPIASHAMTRRCARPRTEVVTGAVTRILDDLSLRV